MLLYPAAIVILLALEAGISMVEASFFSISRLALERLKHELGVRPGEDRRLRGRKHRVEVVEQLLARPSRLLGAIALTDTLISVSISSLAALFAVVLAQRFYLQEELTITVVALLVLFLLLVFGELVPKLMAVRRPLRTAIAFADVARGMQGVTAPVSGAFEKVVTRILSHAKTEPFPTEADLATMIEAGRERGVIVGDESAILTNLVELERRRVSEIMVPRIDMVAAEKSERARDVVARIQKSGRSRIPVYDGTIDRVTGIFHVKDYVTLDDDTVPVGTVARDAYLIPEVKQIPALLEEFRRLGIHIAVVVDEFGQTAGIVTLEDVLEAIFGEIRDEYDLAEEMPYFQLDGNTYMVDGEIDLKALSRVFPQALRGLSFERLSGFIHHHLGHLPEVGERFRFRNLTLEIRQVSGNAIERVLIRRD